MVMIDTTKEQIYLLYDIEVKRLSDLVQYTMNLEGKSKELEDEIRMIQNRIRMFESNIKKCIKTKPNFSVEELFSMYGQYDRFIMIEFHRTTESFQKYGKVIYGVLKYSQWDRMGLEKRIKENNVIHTIDGVKLERWSPDTNLKNEIIFPSNHIYTVSCNNLNSENRFIKSGLKQMPNRTEIPVNLNDYELPTMTLTYLKWRYESNCNLKAFEIPQLLALAKIYDEELFGTLCNEYKFDDYLPEMRRHELEAKFWADNCSEEEIDELKTIQVKVGCAMLQVIQKELVKSSHSKEKHIGAIDLGVIESQLQNIITFEPEVLKCLDEGVSVYWDFQSFVHIVFRHDHFLQLTENFQGKTKFQYYVKDIKNILLHILDLKKDEIVRRLKDGKKFYMKGPKAVYFDGNYYGIYIAADGRVESFYPLEDTKDNPSK